MEVYTITFKPTGQVYAGVTYSTGKTSKDRLVEHFSGKGSLSIKDLFALGAVEDDFELNIVAHVSNLSELYALETSIIKEYRNKGMSLNQNGGGGFICRKYFLNSEYGKRGYDVNIWNEEQQETPLLNRIHTLVGLDKRRNYFSIGEKNILGGELSFACEFSEFFYEINVPEYTPLYEVLVKEHGFTVQKIKKFTQTVDKKKAYEYLANLTHEEAHLLDKSVVSVNGGLVRDYTMSGGKLFFESFFGCKHACISSMDVTGLPKNVLSDGWAKGRQTHRARLSSGQFTDSEKEFYNTQSERVAKMWGSVPLEDRKSRTSKGMGVRNSKIHTCQHCGKTDLTLGNLGRWHNDNCKFRKNKVD